MDVREKLFTLFQDCNNPSWKWFPNNAEMLKLIDYLIAHGVTVQEWISVKDRLPEDGETVLIWSGGCHVATIEKGITEEERRKMKSGEMPDPEETGWTLSTGYFTTKRSGTYTRADVFGNNKVPYCWNGVNSPMNWFGQDVTHWMPLPQPPKGE